MYFIYVYYINDNEVLYVGKTKKPYRRYYDHMNESRIYEKVNRVDLCEIDNFDDLEYYERYYICYFNPLLNKKGFSPDIKADVKLHSFKSYSIEELKAAYSNYEYKVTKRKHFIFKGKKYLSENEFIRQNFKGYSVDLIRNTRRRIMKKYDCSFDEAYEIMMEKGIEAFDIKKQIETIDKYIIKNQDKSVREISIELNETYDRIKKRRMVLISKGLVEMKRIYSPKYQVKSV